MAKLATLMMIAVLGGCATGPKFDVEGVDKAFTPSRAAAEIEDRRGARVVWGGVILAAANLKEHTQIEVLAYPIDSGFRPDPESAPLGRFLIIKPGYIETADYETGRRISVAGILRDTRPGQIGDVVYIYPVVEPTGLHLWPRGDSGPASRVHFGFGVHIFR